MTHKEIAARLRSMCDERTPLLHGGVKKELVSLAKELDPPRPKPVTVVWCIWLLDDEPVNRLFFREDDALGYINSSPHLRGGTVAPLLLPAHILADDEVAVKVPPVSEWPEGAHELALVYLNKGRNELNPGNEPEWRIARVEAEKMEAEG